MEIKNKLTPTLTPREILEAYSHIELSEDEIDEAIIWGKRKKEQELEAQRLRDIEKHNRIAKESLFQFDVMRTFMINRAFELFKGDFILDEFNESVFNLLCFYHTKDPRFVALAEKMGVKGADIDKGILLAGLYGCGKTWLLKLFAKSVRQTYYIRTSKEISNRYLASKDKSIPIEYTDVFKNAINDSALFNQPLSGLCIDDIGAEQPKNNFGNTLNVIGEIIEERYRNEATGTLLHGTTNLTADQLKEYYGGRVTSRMREIFNFIELKGSDRRK